MVIFNSYVSLPEGNLNIPNFMKPLVGSAVEVIKISRPFW